MTIPNFDILSAIYREGLVPAVNRTTRGSTSYDGDGGTAVHLNRIWSLIGIDPSLLDRDRGSFPVVIEEGRLTEGWRPARDAHSRLVAEDLDLAVRTEIATHGIISADYRSAAEARVRQVVILREIAADREFQETLSQRCHNTALLLLNLTPLLGEDRDTEVTRPTVERAAIQTTIMSDRLREVSPVQPDWPPVVFVPPIRSVLPQRSVF